MKSLKRWASSRSSSTPGTGSQASSAQSPCGQFSSGNSGVVIPISLRYASAEKWSRFGTWLFHPNFPTATRPVVTSVTMLGRPAVPGCSRACFAASVTSVASGTASTSPRPKSGVVRRSATMVACGGTCSPTKVQAPWCPIPSVWMSGPPRFTSGSNTPLVIVPNRVSTVSLPPPVPPTLWQAAHDVPLRTGPSPSATSSTVSNAARPSPKRCSSSGDSPRIGSPNSPAAARLSASAVGNRSVAARRACMGPAARPRRRASHEKAMRDSWNLVEKLHGGPRRTAHPCRPIR